MSLSAEAARVARHFAGFIPGILPSTPAGPAATPLFASASCLRVKTGALNHSATSPELVVQTRRAHCAKAWAVMLSGTPLRMAVRLHQTGIAHSTYLVAV